jgi:hypothetical protein
MSGDVVEESGILLEPFGHVLKNELAAKGDVAAGGQIEIMERDHRDVAEAVRVFGGCGSVDSAGGGGWRDGFSARALSAPAGGCAARRPHCRVSCLRFSE